MNGSTMYALKPLITRNLMTKCDNDPMYAMKNIHEIFSSDDHASKFCNNVTDMSEQVINFLKSPLPEVAALEARQEKILAQLAELKEQVLCLCDVLKTNNDNQSIATTSSNIREPIVVDLIVNVNPLKPCWTILALQKIWKDVNFNVKTYVHSSTKETIPEFFIDCKKEFRDRINVDLIWKDVEDMEIVISGIRSYPLIGETNFLRYLVRQLPNENYENLSNESAISAIQNILDMSHRLFYQESSTDEFMIILDMSKKLGDKNWLISDEKVGIADVAAWSAIKRISSKKMPSNLRLWYERCENTFLK